MSKRIRFTESAASRAMPKELLLEVSQLNLSVRASGCLKKRGILYLAELVSLTEADLLAGRNCGRWTLRELNAMLEDLGLSLSMQIPAWGRAHMAKLAQRYAPELSRIRQAWRQRRYGIDSRFGVETEIASALAAVLKAADVSRMESWIGLDQAAPPTFNSVGNLAKVTRQRIRQIVDKTKRRLAAVQLDMPRLHSAIDVLSRLHPWSESRARSLLVSERLAARTISINGLLRAAEVFGVPVPSSVEHARMAARSEELAIVKKISNISKKISLAGRQAVIWWGCSTIDDVCALINNAGDAARASDKVRRGPRTHAENPPHTARNPAAIGEIMRPCRDPGDAAITTDVVRETLMAQPSFHWLDEESGWFWFEDARDHGRGNPLLRKIDQILAVAPRVNLTVLRAGLARHWRMEGFAPPRRVLASLCRQLKDCRLVGGRTVVATRPRNPATVLTSIERAIVAVFRAHGPMLSSADAFRFCGEAGLREATITMALWSSPMIRRVAQGVYTLVGARVTPSEIETKAKTAISHARLNYQSAQDCGWRPDASGLWATYRVSEPMLLSGKLAAPDEFKTYLDSRGYELRDLEGSRIGHVDVMDAHLSGFLPFFRQRRVDLGDHLRVTFDLAKRVALVELSEEAFDDRGSLQ